MFGVNYCLLAVFPATTARTGCPRWPSGRRCRGARAPRAPGGSSPRGRVTERTRPRCCPPATVTGQLRWSAGSCRASISAARSSAPTRSSSVGYAFGRSDVAAPFAQRPDGPGDVDLDVAHVGRLAGGVRLAGPGPARRTVLMSKLQRARPRRSPPVVLSLGRPEDPCEDALCGHMSAPARGKVSACVRIAPPGRSGCLVAAGTTWCSARAAARGRRCRCPEARRCAGSTAGGCPRWPSAGRGARARPRGTSCCRPAGRRCLKQPASPA